MTDTPETSAMWETIHTLWLSGKFATFGALHRAASKIYTDQCPTLNAIRRKADREMWSNDSALSESISEESMRTASEILNELGMGLSRSLELLTEMAIAPHEDHDRIRSILDNAVKTGEIDAKEITGALRDLRALYSKGMDVSLKSLAMIFQIRGDIGKGSAGSGEGKDQSGIPMDDMTAEEREQHIRRMYSALYQHVENKSVAPGEK